MHNIIFKLIYCNLNYLVRLFNEFQVYFCIIILLVLNYRGESARKDSIAGPEVLAQQQAVMAAVEAEIKQKNSVENPSAFSTVFILLNQLAHNTSLRSKLLTY